MIKYLVTTRLEVVTSLQEQNYRIVMIDGTVPGFIPREGKDLHFDHHREGGAPVQIEEMNGDIRHFFFDEGGIPLNLNKVCIITTQVDADACVAAAYLKLHYPIFNEDSEQYEVLLDSCEHGYFEKLEAIAWDCDHLFVPDRLSEYADFAAQAVAAMKENSNTLISELGLNPNRREWTIEDKERFASTAFGSGTRHLVDACLGLRPFPGERGEARPYWAKLTAFTNQLREQNRITLYRDAVIIDMKGLGGQYIDPRCPLRVVKEWTAQPKTPITLTQREVYVEGKFVGYSYTLGSIPWHPRLEDLDYCKGTFDALTDAEVKKGGDPQLNKWGGRKTVGGSGWNTTSLLSPHEVIDVVLDSLSPTVPVAEAVG